MKKYSPQLYIALAIGITWLFWIPALILTTQRGYALPTIDTLMQQGKFTVVSVEHGIVVVLFSLAVYGPLLAGLAAAGVEGGRRRIAEWFAPTLRWRVASRWYGVMLLIALGIVLLPLALGALSGLVSLKAGGFLPSIPLILGLLVYQLLTSGLGEEPGWRGYLLPHWQAKLSSDKAVVLTGLVWAVWHFPFTIYYTLQGAAGQEPAAQIALLLPALIGQTASLVAMSYIYAWLMEGSRSLWIAVLFHALGNTLNAAANALVVVNPIINLAIAAMPWLVVLLLERLTKQRRRRLEQA